MEKELWYFAMVDVIAALTDSANPPVYWRVLKKRPVVYDITIFWLI
jgi:hypothetical protein